MNKNRFETTRYGTFLLKTRVWSVPAYVHSSEPYVYGFTFSFAFHTMINHDKLNQRRPSMAMGITEQKTRREREMACHNFFVCKIFVYPAMFHFLGEPIRKPSIPRDFQSGGGSSSKLSFLHPNVADTMFG